MSASEMTLISEATVSRQTAGSVMHVTRPFIVTPSAAELAAKKKIRIVEVEASAVAEIEAEPETATDVVTAPLAQHIESSLLTSCATPAEIMALCAGAIELGCVGVCVNPRYVALAVEHTANSESRVITVCGFPLGANASEIKAAEARVAEAQGANEIDMVLPVGLMIAGELGAVRDDIAAVRGALKSDTVLKVIIEASLLSEEQIVQSCVLACEAGADYVKTGTGFAGPTTVAMVELMKQAVGDRCKIKAAGGIKTREAAEAMIAAGAARIGTSNAAAILAEGGILPLRGN